MKALPIVLAAASVAFGASAETQTPDRLLVGRAAIIQNVVQAKDSKETRRINLQDVLFFKDQMITSDAAKTVVEFRDGSTLEMGENAVMTIDEMVFNPTDNTNNKSITLVSGTFRFVSGFVSNKSKVEFHTAAATIGIRGCVLSTIVDSDPNKPSFYEMAQGEATITNSHGTSTLHKGDATSATATRAPAKPGSVSKELMAAAMTKVNKQLGATPSTLPLANAKMLEEAARANAVATKLQFEIAAKTASPPSAIVPTGTTAVFAELAGAEKLGLLTLAAGAARTEEQKSFEAKMEKSYPNAAQTVATFDSVNQKANRENEKRATTQVVTGMAKASPEQVAQVINALASADPSLVVAAAAAAAKSMPGEAAQIAAIAVSAVPDLASQIASAVSTAAPAAAAQVAQASSQAAAQAAAQSAAVVNTVSPALASAVRAALSSGNTTQLQQMVAALVAADPSKAGDIATAATQAIAAAIAQNPALGADNQSAVTSVVVTTLTAAAPAEAGAVLVAVQSNLSTDLQSVAVAAVQSALAPAARGNQVANQTTQGAVTTTVQSSSTFSNLVQQILNTAEIPRRNTASPS